MNKPKKILYIHKKRYRKTEKTKKLGFVRFHKEVRKRPEMTEKLKKHLEKLHKINKGLKRTDETKEKMRQKKLGRKLSITQKRAISASLLRKKI